MKADRSIHGMSFTRPYRIWLSMRQRCEDPNLPNYKQYGAKGVRVCRRWASFVRFWEDMRTDYQPNLQIDRKRNSRGYCKSNCRWVTACQNYQNKTNTWFVWTPKGRLSLADAARQFGFLHVTLQKRVLAGDRGMELLRPVRQYRRAA